MLTFHPIKPNEEKILAIIASNELCKSVYDAHRRLYEKDRYIEPWVGYFVEREQTIVASCGFKGKPANGRVELAYFTFPEYEGQGIATKMCTKLVTLSKEFDPSVLITARTLPKKNASTHILEKNGFTCRGIVNDPEDGDVWIWELLGGG